MDTYVKVLRTKIAQAHFLGAHGLSRPGLTYGKLNWNWDQHVSSMASQMLPNKVSGGLA